MRYNDKENIREYILKMSNLFSKLKALKLKLSKEILAHFILISFFTQYSLFQDYLYCSKEKVESHWAHQSLCSGRREVERRKN